jgi:hypothetical protein
MAGECVRAPRELIDSTEQHWRGYRPKRTVEFGHRSLEDAGFGWAPLTVERRNRLQRVTAGYDVDNFGCSAAPAGEQSGAGSRSKVTGYNLL